MDLFDRKHKIIKDRLDQMKLNWLCYKGGQAYIDERLMRGVHEDDVSWEGKPEIGIPPRRLRTCYVPYAPRVVDKMEEQIWARPIKRDGADPNFVMNCDRTGQNVDEVIQLLQEYWTVCGWGWLGIDRTGAAEGKKTVAEKERANEGVYWTAYAPWEVPDWHYGDDGRLEWAITERSLYDNSDPLSEPFEGFLMTLWYPGRGLRYTLDKNRKQIGNPVEFEFSCNAVPFVRLGELTADPHWFDNVESLACMLLNLASEGHANLSKGVYSLPVVPSDVMERSTGDGLGKADGDSQTTTDEKKTTIERVYSRKHPIMEDEGSKGITRFVTPPSGDLTAYPNEIERMKKALYEVVGLGLSKQKDTADAESADAKQWDHLDINAVLRERALSIQRLETRAVQMSLEFDSEFAAYEPVYPTEFSIGTPEYIISAAKDLIDMGIPIPNVLKLALVRALAEMIPNVNEKERVEILKQAEKMLDEEDSALKRIAAAALVAGKGGQQDGAAGDGTPGNGNAGNGEGAAPPPPPAGR